MADTRLFDLGQRVQLPVDNLNSIELCRSYDLSIRSSVRQPMERAISIIAPFCKDKAQVFIVGCDTGLFTLMLGGRYPNMEILGIEENKFLLEVAEENATLAVLANTPAKFDLQYGSFTDIPVESKTADIVLSYSSLHRWADPIKTLQECNRICKDDGLVFIYDLARDCQEGMILFILQYIQSVQEEFMKALKASYTVSEAKKLVTDAKLGHWMVFSESINIGIASRNVTLPPMRNKESKDA